MWAQFRPMNLKSWTLISLPVHKTNLPNKKCSNLILQAVSFLVKKGFINRLKFSSIDMARVCFFEVAKVSRRFILCAIKFAPHATFTIQILGILARQNKRFWENKTTNGRSTCEKNYPQMLEKIFDFFNSMNDLYKCKNASVYTSVNHKKWALVKLH